MVKYGVTCCLTPDAGEELALSPLGICYQNGWGVPRDPNMAIYWFGKAHAKGLADGTANLGNCYYRGLGVPKDTTKGRSLIDDAAKKGSDWAKKWLKEHPA